MSIYVSNRAATVYLASLSDVAAAEGAARVKTLLRSAFLAWHPDKFVQRFGVLLLAEEREKVLEQVKRVAQHIAEVKEKLS